MRERKSVLEKLPEGVGAEIGVWEGQFSEKLKEKATELHLIDPWVSQPFYSQKAYGKKSQEEMDEMFERVCERHPDCIIHREFSNKTLPTFPDKFLDWVYIDGNHEYEYVIEDILLSLQKTRTLVCGDDAASGGVKKALREFPHERVGSQYFIWVEDGIN